MLEEKENRLYAKVSCDICLSEQQDKLYKLKKSWIVKCNQCGHCFVNPRPSSLTLRNKLDYWAALDVQDKHRIEDAYSIASVQLYQRYLSWLGCHIYKDIAEVRLLDVGCGIGGFLNVALEAGADVTGLEIGESSASYAKDIKKLPVIHGSVWEIDFASASFDVIVMMDVIEHLESPLTAVRRCSNWLKPGGVLLITTPNFNSLFRRLHGTGWWVIDCEDEHIHFFTLHTLDAMCHKCGIYRVFHHIRTFDVAGIIKQFFVVNEKFSYGDESHVFYKGTGPRKRFKQFLKTIGLLNSMRIASHGLDYFFSWRYSPLYQMGEQLVFIGRKQEV